jgi:hypothetical protein
MSNSKDFVAVEVANNQPQAEFLASILRDAGFDVLARATNQGAGAGDGLAMGGAHEILVRQQDADAARELLTAARE